MKNRILYASLCFFSLFLCPACLRIQENKEVVVSVSRAGLRLPGFVKSIALEVQSESEGVLSQKEAARFMVETIREQYPHLVWCKPSEADIVLRVHLGKITSEEKEEDVDSIQFEANLADRPTHHTVRQRLTRSSMVVSLHVFLTSLSQNWITQSKILTFSLPEEGNRVFSDWFSQEWGLRFSSKRIVLPTGLFDSKLETCLKEGKIEESLARLTASLDSFFEIGRKRLLSYQEAYQCAFLCGARATLLEISGRKAAAERDRKRATFLFQKLGDWQKNC